MATLATNLRSTPAEAVLDRGLLIQFTYLQGLDLLTTMAFLLAGVQEANPMVRMAMDWVGSPLIGLTLVKGAALLLGLSCWRWRRGRLLQKANVFFAILVAWNLCCLILGLGRTV